MKKGISNSPRKRMQDTAQNDTTKANARRTRFLLMRVYFRLERSEVPRQIIVHSRPVLYGK